jgi:hypothetical protein
MNYAIQCTDTISGQVGCFGFDTQKYMNADSALQFKAKTPIFTSVDKLFDWAEENGVDLFCEMANWEPKS